MEEKLRSGEHKITSRRASIFRVLLENQGRHLSAEEIHSLVRAKEPETGLATVYRTLELFSDHGIVQGVDFGDGRKRYDLGPGSEPGHYHHHLICARCGKIDEVGEDLLEDLEDRVYNHYGFFVTDHQLKMFGLCRECQTARKDKGD